MLAPPLVDPRTDRVRLQPFHEADVTARYVGWMRDPRVMAMTEVDPDSVDAASCSDYVRANRLSASALLWRIETSEAGHVGNIRMTIDARHRRGDIALVIGEPAMHGRGVGRAAIALVSDHGLAALHLHKLTCGMYASNVASRRAFESQGFAIEARLRAHVWFDGRFEDALKLARFASNEPDG